MDNSIAILEHYHLQPDLSRPVSIGVHPRQELGVLFRDLGFRKGAEIGVGRGAFSSLLLQANPDLELYCVDSWRKYPGYRSGKRDHEKEFQIVSQRFSGPNVHLIRALSSDAAKRFAPDSLDFVYIDANHEDPFVGFDLRIWNERVRSGGILSGHDYTPRWPDVMKAVQQHVKHHKIPIWFVLEEQDDSGSTGRSWFWVKK